MTKLLKSCRKSRHVILISEDIMAIETIISYGAEGGPIAVLGALGVVQMVITKTKV
jgi:hypothetical protein